MGFFIGFPCPFWIFVDPLMFGPPVRTGANFEFGETSDFLDRRRTDEGMEQTKKSRGRWWR